MVNSGLDTSVYSNTEGVIFRYLEQLIMRIQCTASYDPYDRRHLAFLILIHQ